MAAEGRAAALGERGAAFWGSMQDAFEFEAKESELLFEACRSLDRIDALEAVLEAAGLVIAGSTGQQILHPAVAELRQQQAQFGRLAGLLHLPEDERAAARFRSTRAHAGSDARWLRSVG